MPSRHRVPGTLGVRQTPGGPVRVLHSATRPVCEQCGTNDHVRRLWHGGRKVWFCNVHYRVTSTKRQEATLMQRLMHKLPEPETMSVSDVFPNRRARRGRR